MAKSNKQVIARVLYNVHCHICGAEWNPDFRSSLWWKARQSADAGDLDAFVCSGEDCGCVEGRAKSTAPFRVFGYTDMLEYFDIQCKTFVDAVRAFKKCDMDVAFIEGVSLAVEHKLRYSWLS